MTSKLATVIIPSSIQHSQKWLYRAIESARGQTIPVDVKWMIDTGQRRAAWVRNRLVEQVETPFVIPLDADDWLHPHFLEKTLAAWVPGSYVYTDMVITYPDGYRHVPAISCYAFEPLKGEANFHNPAVLMPTEIYRRLGGMDEILYGGEDTDFFLKANSRGVRSIVVREPLVGYSEHGHYSRDAQSRPGWKSQLAAVFARYERTLTMACCGDIPAEQKLVGIKMEGDVLASPTWNAVQKTHGRISGRYYGRLNRSHQVWVDPRDLNAKEWRTVENWEAAGPSPSEVKKTLEGPDDPVTKMERALAKAGVRVWTDPPQKVGYDMQQVPAELAPFLVKMQEANVRTVLEIGTGESAGLARFLVEQLGMEVVSVDINAPTVPDSFATDSRWTFVKGDSHKIKLDRVKRPDGGLYDLVFIDGGHEYEDVKADYERFAELGRIVALHDVSEESPSKGVNAFYHEVAYTDKGNRRKNWNESITPGSRAGIAWYTAPAKAED